MVLKLTPSRVREYMMCPRRFEHDYVLGSERGAYIKGITDRMSSQKHPAVALGATLHKALDTLHKPKQLPAEAEGRGVTVVRIEPTQMTDEDIRQLLASHWQSTDCEDQEQADAAFEKGCSILKYYLNSSYVPTGVVLATEAYLSCTTTLSGYKVELSCRADRLELHPDGMLEILDYKAPNHGYAATQAELASDLGSFLYFVLAWHHFRHDERIRNVRISQLNLISLGKTAVQYDHRQIVEHRTALTQLVVRAHNGPLEPYVNVTCPMCPYKHDCPAWSELDFDDLENWQQQRGLAG